MTKVAAFTNFDPSYPGYVNLTANDDGSFRLIVRGDPRGGVCGDTISLTLSAVALGEWLSAVDGVRP